MTKAELDNSIDGLYTDTGAAGRIVPATHRTGFTNVSDFMYKNVKRRYFHQDFGGKADYKREIGCSMAAGSNIVTAPTGAFESDIVGKIMKVPLCGPGGNDLVSPVTQRDSAGQVRLLASADAAAPVSTGDRTVTWGTDDTTAVRATVAAIDSARRGILRFEGLAVLNGGLVGTVDGVTYNGQIAIPYRSYTDPMRGSIEFEGSTYMNSSDNGPGNVGYTRPALEADGVVSFLTTSTPGAAVFATGGATGVNFCYSNIAFRKIKVLVPTNSIGVGAGIGGINMQWAGNHQIEECISNIDDNLRWSADPVYNHVGFENNNYLSDGSNYWRLLNSYGFRDGFKISSEHMIADLLQAFGCDTAFNIKKGQFSLLGRMWQAHWGGGAVRITDECRFNILGLEIEALGVGIHPITGANFWALPRTDGLYVDETVGKIAIGSIIGGNYSGGVMGFDPANVGANVSIQTFGEFAQKMRT